MVEVVFIEPNITEKENDLVLKKVVEVLEKIAQELQEKRED